MSNIEKCPKFLYKYREPCIEKILPIVAEGKLWAADPNSFNDPFDCYPYIDTSLTKLEILENIDTNPLINSRSIDNNIRKKFLRKYEKQNKYENSKDQKKVDWTKSLRNLGVVCLSEDNSNILMWSHYAASHTGVCIGISTKDSKLGYYKKVIYSDKRPTFTAYQKANPINREMIEQALLKKAKAWEYEREWRCFVLNAKKREVLIPKESIKHIFLGINVKESFKEELKSEINSNNLDIELIQLYQNEKCYRLEAKNFILSNSNRPVNKFTRHQNRNLSI